MTTVTTVAKPALDLAGMYPDLFEGLAPQFIRDVCHDWAMQWHEGWVPNRGDVADSISLRLGHMTDDDFERRAVERGRSRRGGYAYPGDER